MSYVAASTLRTHGRLVGEDGGSSFSRAVELLERNGAAEDNTGEDIDLRQLRHHTKNTLQRILGFIAEAPGLCDTPAGEKIIQELEHRISLSAKISNALFGLTDTPGSMSSI
jgi:hypothetical protein